MLYDMHSHCDFSPDSKTPLDTMCSAALELGFKGLAITDHLDIYSNLPFGMMYSHRDIYSYDAAAIRAGVLAARKKYEDRLMILYGVELGQPHLNPCASYKFANEYDFDVVVASLHCRHDGEDYFSAEYQPENLDFMLKSYLNSTLDMVKWGHFDILAHMDYMLRYTARAGFKLDLYDYRDRVDEILELIIKKEIALEINTGGARYPTGVGPDTWVFKHYKKMGGKLITIGTDSHRPEHFTQGLERACQIAREAGFSEAVYYKNRKPFFYRLAD
jgi:histidinol-phosphatase (PHP family)